MSGAEQLNTTQEVKEPRPTLEPLYKDGGEDILEDEVDHLRIRGAGQMDEDDAIFRLSLQASKVSGRTVGQPWAAASGQPAQRPRPRPLLAHLS